MKNYSQEDILYYKKMNKLTLVLVLLIGIWIGWTIKPQEIFLLVRIDVPCQDATIKGWTFTNVQIYIHESPNCNVTFTGNHFEN